MGLRMIQFPDRDDILEFVTLAKMKESLRISYTKEDRFIEDCIVAAYDHMAGEKGWLNRSILPTKWRYTMPLWPKAPDPLELRLPMLPYLSDLAVSQWDGTSMVAWDASNYYLDPYGKYGYAYLSPLGASWPAAIGAHPAGISFDFTAGYGVDAEDIADAHPSLVKALMMLAGDYFRHREDTFVDIRMVEIDRKVVNNAKVICGRYKIYNRVA